MLCGYGYDARFKHVPVVIQFLPPAFCEVLMFFCDGLSNTHKNVSLCVRLMICNEFLEIQKKKRFGSKMFYVHQLMNFSCRRAALPAKQ